MKPTRSVMLKVRLTPKERRSLGRLAKSRKMTVSEYVRDAIVRRAVMPILGLESWLPSNAPADRPLVPPSK